MSAAELESARLYSQRCAACHGARGQGVLGLGNAVMTPEYLASRDDSTIARFIHDGVPGKAMMGFGLVKGGGLTPAQIDAMVSWMRAQGTGNR